MLIQACFQVGNPHEQHHNDRTYGGRSCLPVIRSNAEWGLFVHNGIIPYPARGGLSFYVIFKRTGVYRYHNVPKEVYQQLLDSDSKGGYMRDLIIDMYPTERVR